MFGMNFPGPNIFISGIGTIGIIYGLIRVTGFFKKIDINQQNTRQLEVIRLNLSNLKRIKIKKILFRFSNLNMGSRPENDEYCRIFRLIKCKIDREMDKIDERSNEQLDEMSNEQLDSINLLIEYLERLNSEVDRENSPISFEQEEESSPQKRKQLWYNLKFKQMSNFWNECSLSFDHHDECCCCFERGNHNKKKPCGHIICYDCCVSLFNSTLSDEEQGISETKCPVCRQVIEPELVCNWCQNNSGVDSDFHYFQDDKIFHQNCLRFVTFPSNNPSLRISSQ